MSLPPERISIKRRRQDDPVETLYLDQNNTRDHKRRFTDFFFQRIRASPPHETVPLSTVAKTVTDTNRDGALDNSGIPSIRTTKPGDEIKDAQRRRAERKKRLEGEATDDTEHSTTDDPSKSAAPASGNETSQPSIKSQSLASARRFHLSREYSPLAPLKQSSGIRKQKPQTKRHLATFVEKGLELLSRTPRVQLEPRAQVVDRIVAPPQVGTQGAKDHASSTTTTAAGAGAAAAAAAAIVQPDVSTGTFVKVTGPIARTGQSMRDHPSTWNYDSDQLADELAAFAMQVDGEEDGVVEISKNRNENEAHRTLNDSAMDTFVQQTTTEKDEDYIYETYQRVTHDRINEVEMHDLHQHSKLGVLVIEEADEELWESYAASEEEETNWDEEDADSNAEDNPANEYPEDELSEDDEFGYESYAYRHRRNASDEEEFDLDTDEGYEGFGVHDEDDE